MLLIASPGLCTGEPDIPPALRTAILANYPLDLLCAQESERQHGAEIPPIEEHFASGWIQVLMAPGFLDGLAIAIVTYSWRPPLDPDTDILVFREQAEQWHRLDPIGHPGALLSGADPGLDLQLQDVDADDVPEIVIKYHTVYGRISGDSGCIGVWKVTESGLQALTSVRTLELPAAYRESADNSIAFPQGKPPECEGSVTRVLSDSSVWWSSTGSWFRDLDGDGKLELILGPDKMEDPDPDPAEYPPMIDATGYRIYALRNGVYSKVAETAVVAGWALPLEPEVAAAIRPGALPQEELLLAGEQIDRSDDTKGPSAHPAEQGTLTLYCIAPDGYDPRKVDWSSLVIAGSDPAIRPVDEGVDHPAPYDVTVTPQGWLPSAHAHQLLYLEMTRQTRPDDFSMADDDPVIIMGPGARLHFTSPYRVLRFDRSEVLAWLAGRWRDGKARHELKSCFTKDGREWCYTPIGLPFEVRLNTSVGPYPIVAHGTAMLWVRN
jgi:hypothetical protein